MLREVEVCAKGRWKCVLRGPVEVCAKGTPVEVCAKGPAQVCANGQKRGPSPVQIREARKCVLREVCAKAQRWKCVLREVECVLRGVCVLGGRCAKGGGSVC